MKFIFLIVTLISLSLEAKKSLSDEQIKKILIEQSIQSYSGRCPCPYSSMKNGRACGRRSAYSRPGGASPLCYPSDITPNMIQDYKNTNSVD